MNLAEAKTQFINSWGAFGTQWGINRTMAQIHALLLISAHPVSQDEVMEELNISRGNVNMNMRELITWGLIERVVVSGERREFFIAEKDIHKVASLIINERKKRELAPMMKLLTQLESIEGDKREKETRQFLEVIGDIKKLGNQAETLLNTITRSDANWLTSNLLKLFSK